MTLSDNNSNDSTTKDQMYAKQKLYTPYPYTSKIDLLLNEPEIRFAGLIDHMGKLIVGDFKKGVKPLVDEADRRKKYMELVLRVSTGKDFDQSLGRYPIQHHGARK